VDLPETLKVDGKGLPGKVFLLRQRLYLKAKRERAFRFYTLYEAVCRAARDLVADNDGKPGMDGLSIEQVQDSDHGVSGFLGEIEQSLKDRTYRPQPVKRVYIPKANSKLRPLGIPVLSAAKDQGPRGANGVAADRGADLRGGLPGLFVRTSAPVARPTRRWTRST
jgi:hypothetical protein